MNKQISFNERKLPVFIFPNALHFYSDDTSSYQQNLTLYNPYDFTIKYKVMSTAREKYRVYESEGSLKARCCLDIIFKHVEVNTANENVRDRFRIQIMENNSKKVIGKKDIESVLLHTADKKASTQSEDDFKSLPHIVQPFLNLQQSGHAMPYTSKQNENRSLSWWMVLAIISAIMFLMLPLENEVSILPKYLRVTTQQKYTAVYILGILTMMVIQRT